MRRVNKFIVCDMLQDTIEMGLDEPKEILVAKEVRITCADRDVPERDVYRFWKTVNGKHVYEYVGTRRK